MNSRSLHYALIAMALLLFSSNGLAASPWRGPQGEQNDDGIIFDWNKAPWQGVIEWFADEAGLILEEIDRYPKGTFSLTSDRPYTPVEAIDELNHKLRLSDPPKTLLRNGLRLFLVDAKRELPAELVETIDVSELDQRGKYEPLQVIFDVNGLNINDIEGQIEQRIQSYNRGFLQVYGDTNQIFVRESGENLRFIRDIISRAKTAGMPQWSELTLTHISAELFLQQISGIYELDDNYSNIDGTLKMLVDSTAGAERIVIRGTPALILDVQNAVKMFDKQPAEASFEEDDPLVLKIYSVPRDTKETFEVIDRLLFDEGGSARVQQGSETGKITVRGRKRDHQIVQEYLDLVNSNAGGGIRTIQLNNGDAVEVLTAAQTILGITPENVSDNVSMLANSVRDFIILRGSPSQVTEAVQVIEELDRNSAPVSEGLRTPRQVVPMSSDERDRILEMLPDYLPTLGRENSFELRAPQQTEKDEDSLFRQYEDQQKLRSAEPSGPGQGASTQGQGTSNTRRGFLRSKLFEAAIVLNPSLATSLVSAVTFQAPNAEPVDGNKQEGYQAPQQVESVPGSPVKIWGTEFGIVVDSADLDAGEDVVYLIDSLIGEGSEEVKPQVYQLKHCKASYMKQLLESLYGLDSGSGSGGGGGGGLLGGIADNVMGDAGGDMVDSLFGGGLGLGGDSSSNALEGDVSIGVDSRLNYLWVLGATEKDLSSIDESIKLFDVSSPPHNPETSGQIYGIQVKHRDVEEMKEKVESLMSIYFADSNGQAGGGGNGGGGEAANAVKMLRQLSGGGGGNGGGSGVEEVQSRGYLSVDAKTSKLLFLGPKFIFLQVEALVMALDQPEVEQPRMIVELNIDGDAARVAAMLKEVLGSDKVEIAGEVEETATTAAGQQSKNKTEQTKAANNGNNQNKAIEKAFQQAIRNRASSGSNRGGGSGGNRGGGGTRGGGGGTRGGGGR